MTTRSAPRLRVPDIPVDVVLEDEGGFVSLRVSGLSGATSAEHVEFERCAFGAIAAAGLVLPGVRLTDCTFVNTDLANVRAERGSMLRVEFDGSRLTGLQWPGGALRDVRFAGCRMDFAALRFTALHAVEFVDCNLTRADFTGADLTGARFERCDLTAAQFSSAKMAGTYFAECTLDGVGGVASFAGATVQTSDLVSLARMMAGALGISIDGS